MRCPALVLLLILSACGSGSDAAWAPDNNTFPSLPSHPMRIVGWASLSQDASLETAIEYAGHAELHVNISRDALDAC